ncbi:MAG TPA: hypothetical protein VEB41_05005 [Burkholderiales bacterium]|nr:hypothetical protein [Burkholderiales bacterium]
MKALLGLLALSIAGLLASPDASAHGRRARVSIGLHFGAPFHHHWHGWHPWPYYVYAPPPVYVAPSVVHVQPPVYVERHEPPIVDQQGWWYYCDAGNGYYPYVKECPGGWRKVPPTPQQ